MAQTHTQRPNYKWLALGVAATSTVLGTSDFSIVLIALPTLTEEFGAGTSTVVWVSLGFQLVSLGLVLPAGRFGDLLGTRRVFIAGMLIYAVGMLLAGLSPNIWALILARMVQSAGSAMTNALSSAIVTSAFPRSERGMGLGILMSSAGIGMMIGPSLGGLLLGTLGWQWIFLVRVPLAVAAFVVAVVFLERTTPQRDPRQGRFDVAGAVLLFLAAAAFAFGVNRGSSQGFDSAQFITLMAACAVLVATFIAYELRTTGPVLELRLFVKRAFAIGCGLMVANVVTISGMSFLMPFYLMLGRGMSPAVAGLVLLAGPAMTTIASPLAGRLSDRVGPTPLTFAGLIAASVSFFAISSLPQAAPVIAIVALLALGQGGTAFFNSPNQSAIMGAAPPGRMGTVSALVPTLRNIGLITGIAGAEAIFVAVSGWSGGSASGTDLDPTQRQAVVDGVNVTLRVLGGIAGIAAVIALMRGEDT